jgi:Kef-type K+ transport system membrane component KefB
MNALEIILILLVVTKAGADIAKRFGQPALVGELLGGVVLGAVAGLFPNVAGPIADVNEEATFKLLLDLAVFFLMLVAGLEMRPSDMRGASGKAVPIAIAGMLVPLGMGIFLGQWWLPESDWKFAQSLFLGVALAITAVPVAVKVLMDLQAINTPVGKTIVAAAVIDDVLSLVLLAVLTSLLSAGESVTPASIGWIVARAVLFFAVAYAAGKFLLPVLARLVRRVTIERAQFTLIVIFGLALSVFAELLHMHFLIGAFAAGLLFTEDLIGSETFDRVQSEVETLTLGFLAPVFFASIGIHLSLEAAVEIPVFVGLLLLFAIAGKFVGAGGAALAVGMNRMDALAMGSAMNARGAVEIIIADIALRAGLFSKPEPVPPSVEYMFSAVVIVAIVTTLMSPVMLRRFLKPHR